jgi:hypothetical protein
MPAESLNGLPVPAQLLLYGLIGLFIAIGVTISYFRTASKEKSGGNGMVLAGDSRTIEALTSMIERLIDSVDRLDGSLQRSTEAVRDSIEITAKVRVALMVDKAMPPNEEMLILLKRLDAKLTSAHGGGPAE